MIEMLSGKDIEGSLVQLPWKAVAKTRSGLCLAQIRSLEPPCVMAVLLFLLQSLQLSCVISGQALG